VFIVAKVQRQRKRKRLTRLAQHSVRFFLPAAVAAPAVASWLLT
jgi:hypothetical protein